MSHLFNGAFAIGLLTIAWVGLGFVGGSWMAAAMSAVIGAAFLAGAFELRQFRAGTRTLRSALQDLHDAPASIREWLDRVPATLREPVRLRIEEGRGALPGPALTPYLAALLVMLGMLGTFLGMVVTFKGTVFALERSADLQAIRSALAEPIKGLGLAFGTSVAGVAASAMLGLMSAVSRRERVEVARLLDNRIAGVLAAFSPAHQRQEALRALQAQAGALPQVVERLQALMERIEQRSRALDEQLLERHGDFQRDAATAYTALSREVGASLQASLEAGGRAAGESIRPVVEAAMARFVRDAQALQQRVHEAAHAQVEQLSRAFEASSDRVTRAWTAALEQQSGASQAGASALQGALEGYAGSFEQRSAQLLAGIDERLARAEAARAAAEQQRLHGWNEWVQQHGRQLEQLAGAWRVEMQALREDESRRGGLAVQRLGELQAAVTQHLATLGAALEAPLSRLLQTAAEVPQAAAGVIGQLREEMARVAERENLALQERSLLLEQLQALLTGVNQAAGEQRTAIQALVDAASAVLHDAGERFSRVVGEQAGQVTDTAAQVTASSVELASLAEGFAHGVQLFQASTDKLTDNLQRIEASLNRSTARSDEQLAYYVAQAREVIDLSIASQQGLLEHLRQLQSRPALAAA
ncbi:MAG TPA: DUF802 domain-containing protein [Ramlibacter sp.]|nr:DUF802 domain-containing protein [Ramlibacter sp.]